MIQPVIASEGVVGGGVDELCPRQVTIGVVIHRGVGPCIGHFSHITQIDGVVHIPVDFISLIIEVVESAVVERPKRQPENCAYYRGSVVRTVAVRPHRTRNRTAYRPICPVRWRHGATPIAGSRTVVPGMPSVAVSVAGPMVDVPAVVIWTAWHSGTVAIVAAVAAAAGAVAIVATVAAAAGAVAVMVAVIPAAGTVVGVRRALYL